MNSDQIWQKNILALHRHDPLLAQRLLSCTAETGLFRIGNAQDGSPMVGIRMENGHYAALGHSMHPAEDAQGWVNSLGAEILKDANILLLGAGSGYHCKALFRGVAADTHLWIAEPDLALFQFCLRIQDFSGLMESKRVHFIVGTSPSETAKSLFSGPGAFRAVTQGIKLVYPPMSQYLYQQYIKELAQSIQETLHCEGLKFNTTELQGETILVNVLANLPAVLQGSPVLSLLSQAAGVPALLIGPGPSLEEAIPWIRKVKDSALLIAVDTAHRILKMQGIQADLVVSLDFTELNYKHFEGFDSDEAFLIAFPGIDPRIPQKYLGRTFFYDHAGTVDYSPGATQLLQTLESLGPLGRLISYGSTAHSAYHLARLMGCSPIIFTGNDLSFPSDKRYAEGAMQNELKTDPNPEAMLLDVLSNDGNSVKTIALYKIYLETFGDLIEGTGGTAVNTSAHGALIRHCPYIPMEKVLENIPSQPVDKNFLRNLAQRHLENQKEKVRNEICVLIESCRRARKKLQRLCNDYETIRPGMAAYPVKILQFWKSFAVLMNEEERAMRISTALCSRSSVALMGYLGNAGFFGGNSPEQNNAAYNQGELFLQDFLKALKTNADLLSALVIIMSN